MYQIIMTNGSNGIVNIQKAKVKKMKLNRLVSTADLTHEEWLKYRKKGIGGSDAGAICGLNPYRSPMSVYIDKTEDDIEDIDSEAMRQGRDLEQYVAERFCDETGKKVRRANAIFYNPGHPFMTANIDRLIVGENAGLECKTASAFSADKWSDGKIPESYEIQCHHYMAVTGADSWYIACVILGKSFIWQRIERDEEIIRFLTNIEGDFWNNHVLPRVMPNPDGSKACDEIIKKYYPRSGSVPSVSLYGFDDKLKRRQEIKSLEDKLETERKTIDQEIQMYMKEAEIAQNDHYKVSWKTVESNRIDSKKLKKDYPQIYAECCKLSVSRKFEVKEI